MDTFEDMNTFLRTSARLGVASCLVATLWATTPPAAGTDLDSARQRAQAIADRVTLLEHRLARLHAAQEQVTAEVVAATRRLGTAEVRLSELAGRYRRAREHFVRRAIAIYKAGPGSELALMLSADNPAALFDLAEAASRAARADQESLRAMLGALRARARAQTEIDARKQRLMAAEAEIEALEVRVEGALDQRRAVLERLTEEIRRLEEIARLRALRAAAAGADLDAEFARLLRPTGPAEGIPDGYLGTGIAFEGIASWYGPGFAGNNTAAGQVFDPSLYTAASRDLPFGTLLFVTFEDKGVVVVINDRGPYIKNRILDLSRAAAEAIGLGLGWVRAEILVPEPI